MAVSESTDDEKCSKMESNTVKGNKQKVSTYENVDIFVTCLSLGTFIADFVTDIILVVNYFNNGYLYWSVSTLLLVIIPAIIIQLFSMRWHITDETVTFYHWITHFFLLGIVQRHVLIMKTGFEARSSGDPIDIQRLYHQQNDACMLHLFECFMESAPQLVLQLYIMITLEDWHSWTGVSAAASLISLAWALTTYTRAMRRTRQDKCCMSRIGLVLQAVWRGGMITARISVLVLFAVAFQFWILILMGVHWLVMTVWIMFQKTDFCETAWEERIYNCVVGVIYCFCFFNIQEGRSRKRALVFYIIIILENISCFCLSMTVCTSLNSLLLQVCGAALIAGSILGVLSMLLYYRFFHPSGPIKLFSEKCKTFHFDGSSKLPLQHGLAGNCSTIRSLKNMGGYGDKQDSLSKLDITPPVDSTHQGDESCADKNLLLTHCAESPNTPCVAQSSENCESSQSSKEEIRQKRRGFCSPDSFVLGLSEELEEAHNNSIKDFPELETACTQSVHAVDTSDSEELKRHKRHAICSTAALNLDGSNAEAELQEVLESEDSNSYGCITESASNEEISNCKDNASVDACTPSEGDDSPSEVLSVPSEVLSAHDYENMCAVNIARERWGLRSWRGYDDIETWLHEDSVVMDRRRDTLTSTATTVTSTSSENSVEGGLSSSSPPPIPCRQPVTLRTRQDDYMDTLVYDLAGCEAGAQFVMEPEQEVDPGVFTAQPYIVDQHGVMFPLTTLDTIAEETEECSTSTGTDTAEFHNRNLQFYGSASTLVATIDEIRHGDSVYNIYSSTEPLWSPHDENYLPNTVSIVPQSHLSHEEVLFLSNLRTSPEVVLPIQSDFNYEPQSVSDQTGNNIDQASVSTPKGECVVASEIGETSCSKKRNRPRRKFSLIREKFEPKKKEEKTEQESASHSTAALNSASQTAVCPEAVSEVVSKHMPIVYCKQENYTSIVPSRIIQWDSYVKSQNSCNSTSNIRSDKDVPAENIGDQEHSKTKSNFSNLRESRRMFLKQVLSSPKFQPWNKKNSPSSKVVPA